MAAAAQPSTALHPDRSLTQQAYQFIELKWSNPEHSLYLGSPGDLEQLLFKGK